jgi:phage terminase large subunit GpA-like protein
MPPELVGEWATAWEPPPRLTVSEWADAERRLPESSGASGGQWRTDATPYLRGIQDAVHEPGVRKIAVRKGAQLGGSEALHNILGYFMEHDPCPMLFVHPTAQVAEEWSKERLADMIRSTPALAAVVQEKRSGRGVKDSSESTLSLKMFPGGFLALGGANTPNTFARRSVRIAIGDDVDRFPAVVGDEGDPADLLVNRTTTFYDALCLFVSTPTLKGGRIDTLYERSDRRQFFVACPVCGHEDFLTWNDGAHFRVGFDDRDATTARLECPMCLVQLPEPARRRMIVAAGQTAGAGWRATATALEAGLVGFHVPSLLSTLGNVTLQSIVEKWLSARDRGKEALRVFVNTTLAEAWEDRSARMEPHALLSKREAYGDGVEVPAAAPVLTCGVDVQDNRFELQVIAWGPAMERWVVDWRVVPGNPRLPESRDALLEALSRRYTHASGHLLPIHATCIDTGFLTDDIYEFVLQYQTRRIFATKGYGGKSGEPIVGKPSEKKSGRSARPVRLYPVNVDDAKADLLTAITLDAPGAGYMHFPVHLDAVDEEYFAQLCAEHKETIYNKGGWRRRRNGSRIGNATKRSTPRCSAWRRSSCSTRISGR